MSLIFEDFLKVCELEGGTQPPKEVFIYENRPEYIRMLQIQDFSSDGKAVYIPLNQKTKICNSDDILIARYGASVGKILRGKSGSYNVALIKTIPDKRKLNNNYLYFFLTSPIFQEYILKTSRRAAQAGFNKEDLARLQIPLPPLPEQKRIAEILDKADELRAKRKEALAQLDSLVQSTFLEMFGDPVTNPKGWEIEIISNIGEVITGSTPPRNNKEYYGDSIEWIKSDNINTPSYFLTTASEYLSISGKNVSKVAPVGSLLVTCIAGSPSCIGNVAVANREVSFNQQINAFVPSERVLTWYAFTCFLVGKKLIQSASNKSMKGMVSKSSFLKIPIPLPPLPLQQKFATIVESVERQKESMRAQLQEMDTLFASLQDRAFKGEL